MELKTKLDNGREYRNFYEIRAEGEAEDMRVEGYATVFDTPYELYSEPDYQVLEQIDAKAFEGCDMSDVIMQYDHRGRVFARTKNNTLTVEPDDKGLFSVGLLGGTDIGRQLYQEIKGGYTDKMSFGFNVAEEKREIIEDYEEGKTTVMRTITKIAKLYDVSAVSLPANDATEISARSLGEGVIAECKAERLRAIEHQEEVERIRLMMEV